MGRLFLVKDTCKHIRVAFANTQLNLMGNKAWFICLGHLSDGVGYCMPLGLLRIWQWYSIMMSRALNKNVAICVGMCTNLALPRSTLLTLLNPAVTAGPRQELVPAR